MLPTTFLPIDLARWDCGPGGDALAVPVWSDVLPLRGAAGLLDWRLCGRLSQMIHDGRFSGAVGEKLLLATNRVRWQRVLALGVGESGVFGEDHLRQAMDGCLEAVRRLGGHSLALALPGRDIDLIRPDRAMRGFLDALAESERANGAWLERLTVIDSAPSAKSLLSA
jgi:leucyl aminopeptidase